MPHSTRHLFRRMLDRLPGGQSFVTGLEVEFHITRLWMRISRWTMADSPARRPTVELIHHGYQHLTEQRLDRVEPIVDILRRDVLALGLDLSSVELEFGPSQVEFVFRAAAGYEAGGRHGAVPQRREADLSAAWLSRHVHVPAGVRECDVQWLASASVARRRAGPQSVRAGRAGGAALADRAPLSRGPLRGGVRSGCVHDADNQRLQALSAAVARAGSRRVGARQSRRNAASGGGANPARPASRIVSASRRPILIFILPRSSQPAWPGVAAASEPPPPSDAPYETNARMLPTSLRCGARCAR